MDPKSIHSQPPRSLARLLKLDDEPVAWSPADLAAIFRHQLRSPLALDLDDLAAEQHQTIAEMTHVEGSGALRTFEDVLRHGRPPIELLKLIKDFAKSAGEKEGSVPREVATALYYLSLAVALLRCGQRISTLSDAAVRQGIEWTLQQPWLDEPSRAMLSECLAKGLGAEKGR